MHWYIAKSKPQKETLLKHFLEQWGVETFFPQITRPGKKGEALQPLFPTYMFCRLDPQSSVWPIARWAPGMSYFLTSEDAPAPIPQSLIDYLQLRVDQWNCQGASRNLKTGDKVMVLAGPFAGLEGIFQSYMSSRHRCRILLDVVGRLSRVELPAWEVKEISYVPEGRRLGIIPAGAG